MQRYRTLSGILGALPVFESTARLNSFTKAADELGLSQPAVSRRISTLEEHLGAQVFLRDHNKLELTPEGLLILEAVELGFGHLQRVVSRITKVDDKRKLTIACGFSFATMWFQPRFSVFRKYLSGLEIHLIASEFLGDLDPEMVDIRILWHKDTWPDRDVRPLFIERVCPVCSPAFASRHNLVAGLDIDAQRLSELPLLHCGSGSVDDLDWLHWFKLHGIEYLPRGQSYVYDNVQFTIQAALDGEGIALGHVYLIDDLLAQGNLVQLAPLVENQDVSLFIEFEKSRLSRAKRDKIYKWMLQEVGDASR